MNTKLEMIESVYVLAIVCIPLMYKLNPDNNWYWKYCLVILVFWTIVWSLMIVFGL